MDASTPGHRSKGVGHPDVGREAGAGAIVYPAAVDQREAEQEGLADVEWDRVKAVRQGRIKHTRGVGKAEPMFGGE